MDAKNIHENSSKMKSMEKYGPDLRWRPTTSVVGTCQGPNEERPSPGTRGVHCHGQSGRALKLQTTARHPVLCHCRSCSLIQLFCQWHKSQQHARLLSSCLDLALQFSATTGKHHTLHGTSDAPYELLEHAEQADAPTSTPSISSSIEASRAPPSASTTAVRY